MLKPVLVCIDSQTEVDRLSMLIQDPRPIPEKQQILVEVSPDPVLLQLDQTGWLSYNCVLLVLHFQKIKPRLALMLSPDGEVPSNFVAYQMHYPGSAWTHLPKF